MNSIKQDKKPQIKTINLLVGKIAPQSLDLEEAVLGACMLEKDTFEQVMGILPHHECFYADKHQTIYEAMCVLYNGGLDVDLLTITDRLDKAGKLELVGGPAALNYLTMSVLSTAHVCDHARIVMEKYMRRELIRLSATLLNDAYDNGSDVFELMEASEIGIRNISEGIFEDSAVPIGDTYVEMLKGIDHQKELKSDLLGVTSGYPELDNITLGWAKENLIILAARPAWVKQPLRSTS